MGGGGGGGSLGSFTQQPTARREAGNWYDFQGSQFGQYGGNPTNLLNTAQQSALTAQGDVPGYLSQLQGFGQQLGGLSNQLGGYRTQLGNLSQYAGGLYAGAGNQINRLQSYLGGPGGIDATIASHGALSPEQEYQANVQAASGAESLGTGHSVGTLVSQYARRKAVQDANFNTAYQQGLAGQQAITGVRGQQSGLLGQQGGFAQAGAGITGQQAGLTGQQAGLITQQQGIQTGGLNQLNTTAANAVASVAGMLNPALTANMGVLGLRSQENIAQLSADTAGATASGNKGAGMASGGGAILGALIPVIAGL